MNELKVRKHAADLTMAEAQEFVAAVKALKASGRYDVYVLNHAKAPMHMIHRGPAFLPWHRQFLLDFEKELQDISGNPNLMVPYWDWGVNAVLDYPEEYNMWDDHFLGGNGHPDYNYAVLSGPFRQDEWTIIDMMGNPAGPLVRNFGANPLASSLPSSESTQALLENDLFDAAPWNHTSLDCFRNILEGWLGGDGPQFHNRCHVWVGGSMTPMTSPNDPAFFLLHCYVDKLWSDWQIKHPDKVAYMPESGAMMGHNLYDDMEATVSGSYKPVDLLDINKLGYRYDTDPIDNPDLPDQNPPVDDDPPVIIDPPEDDPPIIENPPVDTNETDDDPPIIVDPPVEDDPPVKPNPRGNRGCLMVILLLISVIYFACQSL